jgi:hypothetical protein
VQVTARDAALNAATDASDSLFTVHDPLVAVTDAVPGLALAPPFPSPGRGATTLRFSLPASGAVRLEIVDLKGRIAWSLDGERTAGPNAAHWDGRTRAGVRAPAGLYFVRLVTAFGTLRARLVRLD